MRKNLCITGVVLCLHPLQTHAFSIKAAMDNAVAHHPLLQMAEQRTETAKGNLNEQASYAYNPELSLEPQRRQLKGGGRANDYYISLSQGIEIGGKQTFRTDVAQAGVAASQWQQRATRQRLQINAARAFVVLYLAKQMVTLRQQQQNMLQQVSRAVAKQLALGLSNQLDLNLARSAAATAANASVLAKQALSRSQQQYRRALGNMDAPFPDTLPTLDPAWQPPADAEEVALASRPDLSVLHAREQQAAARSELAKANRIPDITINAMTGREAGDRLVKLGVTVPFPLLNSHTGAFRAAEAEKARTTMEVAWSKQQARYALQSARDNHRNAMEALRRMGDSNMQQTAKETINLARKAYDAGELDLEELVVHIRQGLDTQITALDMIKQGWLARIRLAEVMGHPEYITEGVQ